MLFRLGPSGSAPPDGLFCWVGKTTTTGTAFRGSPILEKPVLLKSKWKSAAACINKTSGKVATLSRSGRLFLRLTQKQRQCRYQRLDCHQQNRQVLIRGHLPPFKAHMKPQRGRACFPPLGDTRQGTSDWTRIQKKAPCRSCAPVREPSPGPRINLQCYPQGVRAVHSNAHSLTQLVVSVR